MSCKRNNKFGNPTKTETEAIRARNKCCSYSRWGPKTISKRQSRHTKVFSSNGKRFSVKYAPLCSAVYGIFGLGVGLEVFFQKKKSVANVVISVVGYRFYLLVRGSYNYNMPTEKRGGKHPFDQFYTFFEINDLSDIANLNAVAILPKCSKLITVRVPLTISLIVDSRTPAISASFFCVIPSSSKVL